MFNKPRNGWSEVSWCGMRLGQCSYVQDVPLDFMQYCINYIYLRMNNIDTAFDFWFDAEGYIFGITEVCGDFYVYRDISQSCDSVYLVKINKDTDIYEKFVSIMLLEAVEDFIHDYNAWLDFLADDTETKNKIAPEFKEHIKESIKILKEYGDKHGNN